MKLSENDYYKIIDRLSETVYDFDPWDEEVSEEYIKEWINDIYSDLEFDNEDVEKILNVVRGFQEDRKNDIKEEEQYTLCQDIQNLIMENSKHFSPKEIGIILVKLANNYLI